MAMMATNTIPRRWPAVEARVAAMESVLIDAGMFPTDLLDEIADNFEHNLGPLNGAKVVARAWVDAAYKERLLSDATPAIAELGFGGAEGEHMVVVENTPNVHNLVVCTLCSCYPWPSLGLPPSGTRRLPIAPRSVTRGLCSKRWARHWPRTSRSTSGTPVPRSVTWCSPNGRRAPRDSPKRISPRW